MGIGDKLKHVGDKITGRDRERYDEPGTAGAGTYGTTTGATTGAYDTTAAGTTGADYGTTEGAGYGTTERAGYGTTGGAGYAAGTTGAGYGATERETGYTGSQVRTEEVPVGVVETTTTTQQPVVEERTTAMREGEAAVCGQEYFTKTEDRPIVKERKEFIKEHRPVEKEFVVETRATGVEREVAEGRQVEHLGTEERVVQVTPPSGPC